MNRRSFLKNTGLVGAPMVISPSKILSGMSSMTKVKIAGVAARFEREKLVRPFGFKGGYLTELWQTAVKLESANGYSGIGLATQSVLYGDADLFGGYSEAGGNAMMYTLTERLLGKLLNHSFENPVGLLDHQLPYAATLASAITGKRDINTNFLYNALVSIDNAAWVLYARQHGFHTFDQMIPAPYRAGVAAKNSRIAVMYQIPYAMPLSEIAAAAEKGYFVFKIKTGYPGSQEEMLQADIKRLGEIHALLENVRTKQTSSGHPVYTMDANGRYENKSILQRYLDHAKRIGAFERIALYEEPFPEYNNENVADLGIRIAADESVHDVADASKRVSLGYDVMVLKGIAKTLSESLKIASYASERRIPCICADLTVNPTLVDWHKNLAARLQPFPELGMPMMETNGDMNYKHWQQMQNYHPGGQASWSQVKDGVFELDHQFYERSGSILEESRHYENLFQSPFSKE